MNEFILLTVYDKTKISPREQRATVGERVEFVCFSLLPVFWYFKDNILPSNARTGQKDNFGGINYWLVLVGVTTKNSGRYQCISEENDFIIVKDECSLVVVCKLFIQNQLMAKL